MEGSSLSHSVSRTLYCLSNIAVLFLDEGRLSTIVIQVGDKKHKDARSKSHDNERI